MHEIDKRIARWGVDAVIRRLAREHGKTDDEMRARIEAIGEELAEAPP